MKTSLKLIAVLIAAGYPCVAFAEMIGAHLPSVLNGETFVALFSAALLGLLAIGDYSRRTRIAVRLAPVSLPLTRKHESHRLAA